jgi:hypothetical protein
VNVSAPQIPQDPYLQQEQQQAQNELVASLGKESQGDMANLMARYGTQLAMAGAKSGAPIASPIGRV